jgi:hypothetical protein
MAEFQAVRKATVPSLAKVNLDLRVLYKRPSDGFHELRTIFQTISLADEIGMEYTPGTKTKLSIEGNVDIPNNLILRAAEAVMKAAKAKGEVRFTLDKKIPMGGGCLESAWRRPSCIRSALNSAATSRSSSTAARPSDWGGEPNCTPSRTCPRPAAC